LPERFARALPLIANLLWGMFFARMPSRMSEVEAPITATGRRDELVLLVRWVHPNPTQVTVLADQRALLGRDAAATTRLESGQVSRRHAELSPFQDGHAIEDLDSKNGVFVDGQRVHRAPVRAGTVLRIGDFIGVVESVRLADLPGFRCLGPGMFGGAALARALELGRALELESRALWISGECGTGKKLLARALHAGAVASAAFVAFDCRASEQELELELSRLRAGGTLVLVDVDLLNIGAQERVLRELAGGALHLTVTSRRSLDQLPWEGLALGLRRKFSGSTLSLPPLRQRRADIVPLFLLSCARRSRNAQPVLAPELLERLCLEAWPLNVRELDDIAARLLALGVDGQLGLSQLLALSEERAEPRPIGVRSDRPRRNTPVYSPDDVQGLNQALERHRGNLSRAAAELGITRAKAYRMLRIEHYALTARQPGRPGLPRGRAARAPGRARIR
jgi:transcriptional regulator of acetoin/glycerol metabolism